MATNSLLVTPLHVNISEVLTAVFMKVQVFWDPTSCRLVNS